MDGFRDIANLNPSDNDDPLINKVGRELELAGLGTITGVAKGVGKTLTQPESLLGVAGGVAMGTGLSALQLRYPAFRVPGALMAGTFGYFGLKDMLHRAPALRDAIADTWDSPNNRRENIHTVADNFGTPLLDAAVFWGAGRLASGATTAHLYRRGGPLVMVPEQRTGGAMVPHKRADEIAQAYENTRDGIVQIYIARPDMKKGAMGTGFLVSNDGKVATNAHVAFNALDRPGRETRIFHQGSSMTAKILKVDLVNDLAILKINELDKLGSMRPLRLADRDPVSRGSVFLAGHPRGERQLSITDAHYRGNTAAVTEVRKNIDHTLPYDQNAKNPVPSTAKSKTSEGFVAHDVTRGDLRLNAQTGMSGSPVVDTNGTVLGVLHSTSILDGNSYFSRVGTLKKLLSEL